MPWLRVLVLAFAFAHATGLSDALEVACADDCAEQDCDDGCPPICPSCHCAPCPTGVALVATMMDAPRPTGVAAGFAEIVHAPSSPDPGEILHVPIAL